MTKSQLDINQNISLKINSFHREGAKSRVIITHGILEHSGRYDHVARELNQRGFEVITYDLRGHGLSSGEKAYVNSFSDFVSDLNMVLWKSLAERPSLPTVIIGHSMGGLVTYLHSLQQNLPEAVKGYVLMSPAISKPPLSTFESILSLVAPFLRQMAPYKMEKVNILSEDLMTDVEMQERHRNDLMVMQKATISLLVELLRNSRQVSELVKPSQLPTLVLQGDQDSIVNWQENIEVCEHWKKKSTKIGLEIFPGEKHELFNSVPKTRSQVFDKISKFIESLS